MKKKIVIVGALGYLGTELCKIYSGESWKNEIVAIDNRFISERVTQLKNWNIQFFQGEILDLDFLKRHLKDADVVHHLAGVTDVAYVKNEANKELDRIGAVYEKYNGHLGCVKSHIGVMKIIKNSNFKNALVIEDDFKFLSHIVD